jgi:hypothetical protein
MVSVESALVTPFLPGAAQTAKRGGVAAALRGVVPSEREHVASGSETQPLELEKAGQLTSRLDDSAGVYRHLQVVAVLATAVTVALIAG